MRDVGGVALIGGRLRPIAREAMKTAFVLILVGVLGPVLLIGAFVAANWAPELTVEELQARWAPPPSVFVDVAGMRVHLRDEGPREDLTPLVLLHGTGSSLHAWEGWASALKAKRRVIRFDMAGFGLTGPSPDRIYAIDNDVRLVVAMLDQLGVERCVLGGNSLGGAVAWRTALAYPARVEKLILVDAGGYPSHPQSVPIGFRLAQLPVINQLLAHTLPRSLVVQGLHDVFGDPARVTEEMVDRAIAINQREGNRRALVDRFRQRQADSLAHRIPELRLPTLIIWGGRDRLISPDNAERFHRDIAGSALAIFDDLGHAPEEEDPTRTVAAVERFLGPS
jgi:pimeloyl-ACP methyl ester carboxylesterase